MFPQAPSPRMSRLGRSLALALGCAMALMAQAQNSQVASTAMGDGAAAQANVRKDSRAARSPTAKQHEAQLGAIRQAILQATMDRPTRVLSSAWIDDKGALHESAHFQSEAQVRGVRVLSYLQDEQDAAPQVSAEVLPWGWREARTQASECKAPPRPWAAAR